MSTNPTPTRPSDADLLSEAEAMKPAPAVGVLRAYVDEFTAPDEYDDQEGAVAYWMDVATSLIGRLAARLREAGAERDKLDWLEENVATVRPRSVGDADDWWEVECWEYGPPDVAPRRVIYPGTTARAAIDAAMSAAPGEKANDRLSVSQDRSTTLVDDPRCVFGWGTCRRPGGLAGHAMSEHKAPIKEADIIQVRVCGVRQPQILTSAYLIELGRDARGIFCVLRSWRLQREVSNARTQGAAGRGGG